MTGTGTSKERIMYSFNGFCKVVIREFAEKVVVHAPDKSSGHRVQRIDVHYNFIGEIDFSPEFSQYSKKQPHDTCVSYGCFPDKENGPAFVVLSFLMYVFTQPPPRFSPGGGCLGRLILMRLRLSWGVE